MPSSLALFLWFILVLGLMRYDPAKEPGTSIALWVPLIWIFIVATRLPSQWLGGGLVQDAAALEEGNPFDRSIWLVLIVLAIGILMSRSFKWGELFARNLALTAFLCFCLLSVLWSDFPFTAFKRWFRDLGNYGVILIALSDPRPFEAVRTLFRRLCYLLISLCILINKYFPNLGKQYDDWTGQDYYIGATTSKNMLGILCLVSGLFFFWDTLARWPDRKEWRTKTIILLNVSFIIMTLWLMKASSSATSSLCLVIGCMVISATKQYPNFIKTMIPVGLCICLLLAASGFWADIKAVVAEAAGRDPTLTDRTLIWEFVLSIDINPLIGTGYESFWLGPRLMKIWQFGLGRINEAHNGYIQVYLNLGIIGLLLLILFLIASYRKICIKLEPFSGLGSLSFAVWVVLIIYNVTEAAFVGGLLWLLFLPGAIALAPHQESDFLHCSSTVRPKHKNSWTVSKMKKQK
jgi:exopolysaccharide production protein ExoQ